MTGENIVGEYSIEFFEKRSSTGAVVNLIKLLKVIKRMFKSSKSEIVATDNVVIWPSFTTEEELQNWLNEQIESEKMALQ